MSLFIDTCVLVAARNSADEQHEKAKEIMRSAILGDHGPIYTSDFILDEAITLTLVRTKNPALALDVGDFVIKSQRITILYVSEHEFNETLERFRALGDRLLSFTDVTSLVLMGRHGIDEIASFDPGFDGLVARCS